MQEGGGARDGARRGGRRERRSRLWRRLRRTALALLLLLVLAIALRNQIARRVLPAALGPALGVELTVESLSISLGGVIELHGLVASDPVESTPLRALRCERARVDLALGKLWRGLEAIEGITVAASELVIDLDRLPESSDDGAPREALEFAWPRSLPRTTVDLASAALLRGGDSLRLAAVEVRSWPTATGSSGRCRLEASWRLGAREGSGTPLDASFDYAAGRFSRLAATVGETRLVEDGTVDLGDIERPAVELALRLAGGGGRGSFATTSDGFRATLALGELSLEALRENARPLVGELVSVGGRLRIDASAETTWNDPLDGRATLGLTLEDASVEGIRVDRLELAASCAERRVHVRDLEASAYGVSARSGGLTADLARPDLAGLLDSISGSVVLVASDLGRTLATLGVGDDDVLAVLSGARVGASVTVAGTRLDVADLRVDSPCFAMAIADSACELDIEDPQATGIDVDGDFAVTDVAALSGLVPIDEPGLGGEVHGRLSAAGALRELVGELELRGRAVSALGVSLDSLALRSNVRGTSVELDALELVATDPPLAIRIVGRCDLATLTLEGVSLSATGRRLRDEWLPQLPPPAVAYLPDSIDVSAALDGPLSWPDFDLRVEADVIGEDGSGAGSLAATKVGDAVSFSCELEPDGDSRVSTSLSGTVSEGARSADVWVTRLDLAFRGTSWTLDRPGRLRFDRDATALTVDPPLRLESGAGCVAAGLAAETSADGVEWLVARVDADVGQDLVPGEWTSLAPIRLPGNVVLHAMARYRGTRLPLAEAELVPALFSLSLGASEIVARHPVPPATARDVELGFELRRQQGVPTATLALRVGGFEIAGPPAAGAAPSEPFRGSLALEAAWDGRRIALDHAEATVGELSLAATGSARLETDLDRPFETAAIPSDLDLRVDGSVRELSAVRAFGGELRRISGTLGFGGSVRGDLLDPEVELDVALRDGEARFGDAPPLAAIEADIGVTRERIDVRRLTTEIGGSPLEVHGTIADPGGETGFDLVLDGRNVLLVRDQNMRLRADTRLRVTGPMSQVGVSGRIAITDGRLFQSLPLVEVLAMVTRQARGLAAIGATRGTIAATQKSQGLHLFELREPFDRVTFDVVVTASAPIEVAGNVVTGKVRPEVRLRGTGEVPFLVGVIYFDALRIALPTSRVEVESGSLVFPERDPLFPTITMTGTTRIRGYDVTVVVAGSVAEPSVTFSSSPPLPAHRLITLVTTGRDPGGRGQTDEQALFAVVQYLGLDLLRKIWGSDIDTTESVIDRFELDVGRNVSRGGEESLEARFRIARNLLGARDTLYLVGERDEYQHYNAGLRIVFRGP